MTNVKETGHRCFRLEGQTDLEMASNSGTERLSLAGKDATMFPSGTVGDYESIEGRFVPTENGSCRFVSFNRLGITNRTSNVDCAAEGGHEYAENTCPECDTVFCWSCCGGTNVHEGGKYEEDFMLCPGCGHNVK